MCLIDFHGQQAIDTLLHRADDHAERYSAQDTLRAQGGAYLATGSAIISNKGRTMLRIVADDCDRHDTSAGARSRESNTARSGERTRHLHSCRENFLLEVSRHGMTKRDIVPNIDFFMNVPIAPNGDLVIADKISRPGAAVEMIAEMDVLLVISNCPQVNDPRNGFNPTPIRFQIFDPGTERG